MNRAGAGVDTAEPRHIPVKDVEQRDNTLMIFGIAVSEENCGGVV